MQQVLLIDNPMDRASWDTVEVEDVRDLLMERYAEWPATARIYAGQVSEANNVTPRCPADVERLATFTRLSVVVYPEGPVAAIVAAVVAVVIALASFFLLPKINVGNTQTTSPNNGLSERSNRARPGARIPDIFGTVLSVPDLIAAPYRVYINHRQLEIAYMCVGRGAYEVADVRDGDTLIENIQGASVAVYRPFDSPNGGNTPQLQIGTAIGDPVFNASRLNDVNGQTLKAPNDDAVRADEEIQFEDGGIIRAGPGIDFTEFFEPDDEVTIGGAEDSGVAAGDLIFAEAIGVAPGTIQFTSYDPTGDFQAGQLISLGQATFFSYDGSGPSGGGPLVLDGGYSNDELIP